MEHPITELVSGEDIVEHMLWIAAGKKLPERLRAPALPNGAIPFKGHAIESRVYAEDPTRNFLPRYKVAIECSCVTSLLTLK